MNTLGGLLARERRSDAPALRDEETGREYDYHRLLTNAWKTGNLLHHCGVRAGHAVGVVGRTPEAVLVFLGAASLGARVRFDPPTTFAPRAVVAPTADISKLDLSTGGTRIAYGEKPDDPGTRYFERDVWSQNPTLAPAEVGPDDVVLVTPETAVTHTDVLDAAETVLERIGMTAGTAVAVRTSIAHPGTVAAGLVSPLVAGATTVFPAADTVGDVAIATEPAPEEVVVDPESLF